MVELGSGAQCQIEDIAEHVKNNREVRNILVKRNIKPELLPPAEDAKKVEKRLETEQRKLLSKPEPLELDQNKI
jgi:DNA-damage-inducible protein D